MLPSFYVMVMWPVQGIIRLILATDMERHGALLNAFKERICTFSFDDLADLEMVQLMKKAQACYYLVSK